LTYFALDSCHLLDAVAECGADMVGVDWRTPLDVAARRLDRPLALQGNLDPCILLAAPQVVAERARAVLERAAGLPGHVFNLGHGVLPGTPVENVEALVRTVQEHRAGG
jgi:uroporphyrinogen decarboxylase